MISIGKPQGKLRNNFEYLTFTAKNSRDYDVYALAYLTKDGCTYLAATQAEHILFCFESMKRNEYKDVRPSTLSEIETLNVVLREHNLKFVDNQLKLYKE